MAVTGAAMDLDRILRRATPKQKPWKAGNYESGVSI